MCSSSRAREEIYDYIIFVKIGNYSKCIKQTNRLGTIKYS